MNFNKAINKIYSFSKPYIGIISPIIGVIFFISKYIPQLEIILSTHMWITFFIFGLFASIVTYLTVLCITLYLELKKAKDEISRSVKMYSLFDTVFRRPTHNKTIQNEAEKFIVSGIRWDKKANPYCINTDATPLIIKDLPDRPFAALDIRNQFYCINCKEYLPGTDGAGNFIAASSMLKFMQETLKVGDYANKNSPDV